MMRLMGAMEIFTAQQQEDIKDEVKALAPETYGLLCEQHKRHGWKVEQHCLDLNHITY